MRKLSFFVLILLIACTSNPIVDNNYSFQKIEKELSGKSIDGTLVSKQKLIAGKKSNTAIFYKSNNNLINEIDIHINSKQDSAFPILVNYYNQKFNSNKNDSIFNTWHTDSSEFILYKNSDSSILVNIFKRTYL
ncbi:MAG: hypothetical protein ACI8RY_000647 [Urechidicola sp.]|jgi:hypothetical protein|tara:strand:+ start:3785 stop:4186 length:402 start_codon:yes stop_codon:yes gene_type:complete